MRLTNIIFFYFVIFSVGCNNDSKKVQLSKIDEITSIADDGKDPHLTGDQILLRHLDSLGGKDAISKVKTAFMNEFDIENKDTAIGKIWVDILGITKRVLYYKGKTIIFYSNSKKTAYHDSAGGKLPEGLDKTVFRPRDNFLNQNYYLYSRFIQQFLDIGYTSARIDDPNSGSFYIVSLVHPNDSSYRFNLWIDPKTFLVKQSMLIHNNEPHPEIIIYNHFAVTKFGYKYARIAQIRKMIDLENAEEDNGIDYINIDFDTIFDIRPMEKIRIELERPKDNRTKTYITL
ncbi:hypothetical protein HGH93_21765 [Chitinophaga polysaccharea]|uniref:hypothetical protein n=1 Tax=Chitinophaga polysaccharea TaxID=1293035 RepID=UPI001454FED2|nr:hypothetical protein [Chitinophaga polysaccharea]NLR60753.1 hypothetical protein [Chitinophaga polysaccharea]